VGQETLDLGPDATSEVEGRPMRTALRIVLMLTLLAGALGYYALSRDFNIKIQLHQNGLTFEAKKPPGLS